MEIIGIGAPGEPDEEATHETQSMFCFADLIPSSARRECVAIELLVLRSPQFSFTLGPRVSRLQVKGRQHHLSQNIGPAIGGSAGPVPPALTYNYTLVLMRKVSCMQYASPKDNINTKFANVIVYVCSNYSNNVKE